MNAPTKFARLTLVTRDVGRTGDGHIISRWLCDCGTEVDAPLSRAKSGSVKSCGCFAREMSSISATTHGGRNTPEYSSWIAMRRRCLNHGDKDFHRYGGRGVTICASWEAFENFRADMGPRPNGHTLDRIDPNGSYTPDNTRWAPPKVQGRNRRGTYIWHIRGRTFGSITEASEAFGVSEQSVHRWVRGHFDKRRGTMTAPLADCTVEERFA